MSRKPRTSSLASACLSGASAWRSPGASDQSRVPAAAAYVSYAVINLTRNCWIITPRGRNVTRNQRPGRMHNERIFVRASLEPIGRAPAPSPGRYGCKSDNGRIHCIPPEEVEPAYGRDCRSSLEDSWSLLTQSLRRKRCANGFDEIVKKTQRVRSRDRAPLVKTSRGTG